MWGLLILGPALICFSVYSFCYLKGAPAGAVISMFGMLILGLGLTAAASTSFLTYYCNLTGESLFRAGIVNRIGLMALGPAFAMMSFSSISREKNVTPGQCALICAVSCGLTLVPAGLSLVKLVIQHRKGKEKGEDPWG